jgi:predicted ATPase
MKVLRFISYYRTFNQVRYDAKARIDASEWTYFDDEAGDWVSPHLTLDELDDRFVNGAIQEHTNCASERMMRRTGPMGAIGVPYSMIPRLEVEFSPTAEDFFAQRSGKLVTVMSGPNNGGKTFLLKHLFSLTGHGGYLFGCNRFSNIDVLNSRQRVQHEHRQYYENFMFEFERSTQNTENNELNLEHVLTSLKDRQRSKLFAMAESLINNKFVMERTDPDNEFSPFHVMMDGENLRYGSSGTRLFLTILGVLLDERFTTLLIDEPEIGLSPRLQGRLASLLFNPDDRNSFCPHLKQLYIATHSHIFLDRSTYANKYVVTKKANLISIEQVQSASDFHELQFNMLGNELELLYLPSAIVIVEGDSDAQFCFKMLGLQLPSRKIAVVRAHGEGEVLKKINYFNESFGDLASSPYRDRLFVLYDSTISTNLNRIENVGVRRENIFVLSKNGIEHYYPPALVAEAFHCSEGEVPEISLARDPIEYKGHRHSKINLAKFIVERITKSHPINPEINQFLNKLRMACQ